MLSKCRPPSISTVRFKIQLSYQPTLCQATQKHDRSLLPSQLTNSVTIPESTHFTDTQWDHSFCSRALKASAKLGFLQQGKQLHAHVIKLGLYSKLSLQNQILHFYVKCKEFDDTEKLLDEMLVRNIVTWNTMICGIVDCGCNFRLYFRRMLLDNVSLDHITLNGLLRACSELDDIEAGRQLHCFVLKLGFYLNCFVSSALVDLYGKCGLLENAKRVLDEVLCRDSVLWNVMVSCYALNRLPDNALEVFNLMRREGLKGDEFTFSSLLNSCGNLGSSEMRKQIHGLVVKQSFDLDVLVATSLVDTYAKNGNIDDACRVFDGMTTKNVVSWNTMIVGHGHYGDGKEAFRLLRDMLQRRFCPDEVTLASILSSSGSLSIICETVQVHACVIKSGVQAFTSIGNALINAYAKCGSIANALQCFSSVAEPDLVTWTSTISAYAFHGLPEESIKFFEEMLSQGVRPDPIAFLEVLSACSHGGLVSQGLHYFNSMVNEYQMVPDSEHYTCLVDLLSRAGLLDEASNVLALMPSAPGSDTFGAFIGACKVHGNMELANWAAEKLFEFEPSKPVNYALVSNMYASERRWFDVARLRKMMRDNCDYKVPGCSWTEIAGNIQTFVSSDKSHHQTADIYAMLETLSGIMEDDNISSAYNMFDCGLDGCMLECSG